MTILVDREVELLKSNQHKIQGILYADNLNFEYIYTHTLSRLFEPLSNFFLQGCGGNFDGPRKSSFLVHTM